MRDKLVTEEHCNDSTRRIEEKVDRNTLVVDELVKRLDPKLEMIVKVDAMMGLVKWAVGIVFSGGFIGLVIAAWKAYMHYSGKP